MTLFRRAKTRRFVSGILLLLIVDVIWVASAGLTEHIYNGDYTDSYPKPMFTTYFKTVLFTIYLVAFIFWKPWQQACCGDCSCHQLINVLGEEESPLLQDEEQNASSSSLPVNRGEDEKTKDTLPSCPGNKDDKVIPISPDTMALCSLSEPQFEPIKEISDYEPSRKQGTTTPVCHSDGCENCHKVKFCRTVEVRHLPEESSYPDTNDSCSDPSIPLTVRQTALLALLFGVVWFFANYLYQRAFTTSSVAMVNTLSSVSGVFVLLLSAIPICSSSSSDRFTLTKFVVVMISLGGATAIGVSKSQDHSHSHEHVLEGVLCSIGGAVLYACYLVLLKKKASNEDRLEIPMFFGFVGLCDGVVLLPFVALWHITGIETFELPPNNEVWTLLLINGFVGTVLSELLWLWGCFLTTPLVGTLSLSLVTPLSILYSILIQHVSFSWLFFVGAAAILLSFILVTFLEQYGSWDPIWNITKKILILLCCNQIDDDNEDNNVSDDNRYIISQK
ncbi:solute carrier family 35 member F5-like [Dysidea avara]|uniref:solute carrier family 35 member F5-like n=1 Tax=Dysidea avara TaxID=196820 RepID=UPI003325E53B